jgi:hypothetical protein
MGHHTNPNRWVLPLYHTNHVMEVRHIVVAPESTIATLVVWAGVQQTQRDPLRHDGQQLISRPFSESLHELVNLVKVRIPIPKALTRDRKPVKMRLGHATNTSKNGVANGTPDQSKSVSCEHDTQNLSHVSRSMNQRCSSVDSSYNSVS